MTSGLGTQQSQDVSPYTLALLILLGAVLLSAAVWFVVDGMKASALRALGTVADKSASSCNATAPSNLSAPPGKTLTFSLGGQRFTRETYGDSRSPVVIAEFSDFQCPYCMRAVPTIQQLEQKFAGKVQIVHLNFVVHPAARLSALAAECAGEQGKYWAMHDAIFSQQKYDKAGLEQIASGLGLDNAKFDACLSGGKYEMAVDSQQSAGDGAGVQGTPTFLIGRIKDGQLIGKTVVGALPLSDFESAVQEAMNS